MATKLVSATIQESTIEKIRALAAKEQRSFSKMVNLLLLKALGEEGAKQVIHHVMPPRAYEIPLSAEMIKQILIEDGWKEGEPVYSDHDSQMINQLRILGVPVYPQSFEKSHFPK